ncbi:bestrophin-like domain [Legionella hackeliae]|uniref:DUF4239 domain-containing protein n=1 Tax=Legionella hackeliae TaxID=449 RepID=A0A0A8USJ5_LEGHA|nr:DUF4239 domain-containing protein [Legionella hackeliae]KTD12433.1 hypothetical protein Lhac_1304 [Legionella hackeliae]CEK11845.1 conserved membrane protein of unknown function [Legionella hackeliae]STX48611.1 Uncharacterised protein [Legionella hackeliae]
MFRDIINVLSVWQLFLIILVLLLSFSALATYIAYYLIPKESVDNEYSRSTDSILNIMGSGYGVFLGFVIITLWNHYLYVQKNVYQEADDISVVVRYLAVIPPKDRAPMENSLKEYLHAIQTDEWQQMRLGKESDKTWKAVYAMLKTFQNYTPQTAKQGLYYRQILNHMDSFLKERRDRLITVHSILNNELRTALILGAIVIVFLSSLLKAHEGGAIRILANICLALVIGFNLTLALSFDYPFSGDISVSSAPFYQGVLKNF